MQIVRIGRGLTGQPSIEIVGAKAANLARMAALDLPVPPAFVLPISLCAAMVRGDADAKQNLVECLREGIAFLESTTGQQFGDGRNPLLVSVRSGAARSMPGMLDTVLDVGCSLRAVHGIIRRSGYPRFAWDCRRRFLESYATVVLGLDKSLFVDRLAALLAAEGTCDGSALDSEALERLAGGYQQAIDDEDAFVPEDAMEQLAAAAQAVYHSWMSKRARIYRRLQHLDDLQGTAVTVQVMVFGNRGLTSGAGVAFSRDPSTGAAHPVIDVLFEAQGDDVVSGDHTPDTDAAIELRSPAVAAQLREILRRLEREFGDVQDVEFTIDAGKLWLLQTRSAKRTPLAALRFAGDFVKQGLITPAQALARLGEVELDKLTRLRLVDTPEPVARGAGASAGIAVGRAAFSADSAARVAAAGDPVILVRPEISTADVAGFAIAAGIVTAVGGRTAHAALVARQMGKPCVVGCAALTVEVANRQARLAGKLFRQGDWLTIDGETGAIYLGRCRTQEERPDVELEEFERWRSKVA